MNKELIKEILLTLRDCGIFRDIKLDGEKISFYYGFRRHVIVIKSNGSITWNDVEYCNVNDIIRNLTSGAEENSRKHNVISGYIPINSKRGVMCIDIVPEEIKNPIEFACTCLDTIPFILPGTRTDTSVLFLELTQQRVLKIYCSDQGDTALSIVDYYKEEIIYQDKFHDNVPRYLAIYIFINNYIELLTQKENMKVNGLIRKLEGKHDCR